VEGAGQQEISKEQNKEETDIGKKDQTKINVKIRIEKELKHRYIRLCKKNTNLPTYTFILFSYYSPPSFLFSIH
jgi:hypothetical protein